MSLTELSQSNKDVDVLCLSETFIQKGCEANLKLQGYDLASSFCRPKQRRGGVCILSKVGFECKNINSIDQLACPYHFECCGIEIAQHNLVIVCIYRTPKSNVEIFFNKLNELLHNLSNHKFCKKLIICGDWNIDILKQNKNTFELLEILENHNIFVHIKKPTRNKSCIDQVASNLQGIHAEVINLALSDHETGQIITFPVCRKPTPIHWFETRRDYSSENIDKFCECLSHLSFSEVYEKASVDEAYDSLHSLIYMFHGLCFPLIKFKRNNIIKNDRWKTKGIKKSSTTKRKLYLTYKYTKINKVINKKKYDSYSHLLKKCIYKSQQSSNLKYILNSDNTCKATWNTVNSNLNKTKQIKNIDAIKFQNETITNPDIISELFNNFFIDLNDIDCPNQVITNPDHTNNISINPSTIYLQPTDPAEILKIIKQLKNTNSVGYDELSSKILKSCARYICKPLSFIINLSFVEGRFPNSLKVAIVKPIYKKGDEKELNNYRPITLTPVISKIFERAMYARLINFIEKFGILTENQFGFRKNRSTTLACFNLIKEVTESIDKKVPVSALMLDMTKAFDLIDHEILLGKIEKYGIRGAGYEWLKSYLQGRKQCTEIARLVGTQYDSVLTKEIHRSQFRFNKRGVPQGSILGPLIFLLYINDLPQIMHHKCILFADDTTFIFKCTSKDTYEVEINKSIDTIVTWLNSNNLLLNLDKTKLIQFKNYKMTSHTMNIKYKDSKIECVESIMFLGFKIDQNLNWKLHIDHICTKLNRFVYALRRLRKTISQKAALAAYHGFVSSVLLYGLPLWGNSVDMLRAFKVQKKCVRAICGAWFLDSCKPLFQRINVLPLPCMYIREVCIFVKQHPNYFRTHAESLERHTRHKNRLFHPQCKSSFYAKSFPLMAIKIYNRLPIDFKNMPLNIFRIRINKWLLDKCFYSINEYFNVN